MILFTFLFTFLNSGCIIFPLEKTCFSDLSWSISKVQINDVKIWFELWSKAGATPNYIVENRIDYIIILIGLLIGLKTISLIKLQIIFLE